jgi:hypothetical protein
MKKHTAILVISAVTSLFMLTACTDTTAPSKTAITTPKTPAQNSSSTEQIKNNQDASLTISETQQNQTPSPATTPDTRSATATTTDPTEDAKVIKSNETLYAEILTSKNEGRCKELTMDRFIRDCELNILINKAVEEKDNTLCNKASTPRNQADCKTQYEMTANPGPAPSN